MPIIRYFVFVGGLLLTLLFAADRYLPAPTEREGATDPDRTTIRISSARSLPEKIVFDMRPRADAPKVVQAEQMPDEPQQPLREAMAALPAAPPSEIKKQTQSRAEPRPHVKRLTRMSRRTPERRLAFERHDPFFGDW
ncbi:hypothetical protein ABID65_008719 [Bradyrhizobium sp. S3.9.2]|uniref:hypothetical protein n=1 Tax=Bradyrhizobium sp. S3.9.2 TaxID=3156432 RepID=UPI003395E6D2